MGARGTPLGPAELKTLAELYATHGNAAEVARQMKVATSTVTRQLAQLGEQRRAILQRQGLTVGLLQGREHLERAVDAIAAPLLREAEKTGHSFDPQAVQHLASALAKMIATLAQLDEREERRRTGRYTRARTKAETALAQAQTVVSQRRAQEGQSPEEVLRQLTVDELLAVLARIRAEKGAAAAKGP